MQVIIYLLREIAGLTTMTAQQLVDASGCLNCIPAGQQIAVQIYLLGQILSTSTSSGTAITCGNYAGGAPTFVPASGCGAAVDTSNDRIWWYYNGTWN